jgi:hypothetical protein
MLVNKDLKKVKWLQKYNHCVARTVHRDSQALLKGEKFCEPRDVA